MTLKYEHRGDRFLLNENEHFLAANRRLAWGNTIKDRRWSELYIPTDEVKAGDGIPASANRAIWSETAGHHVPVKLTHVGRKATRIPSSDGAWGWRSNVTFNVGTADEETVTAWEVSNVHRDGSSWIKPDKRESCFWSTDTAERRAEGHVDGAVSKVGSHPRWRVSSTAPNLS